jgi:hypothetical protein
MNTLVLSVVGAIYILLSLMMCIQESRRKRINFYLALLLCIFITPFFAYLVMGMLPARYPRGCSWCGNALNEAEYCGLCGKNEKGEFRPRWN